MGKTQKQTEGGKGRDIFKVHVGAETEPIDNSQHLHCKTQGRERGHDMVRPATRVY